MSNEEMKKEEFVSVKTNKKGEKVAPKLGNPKAKIELRDGETDFRNVSAANMKQLFVRFESQKIAFLQNIMLSMCESEVLLIEMCKKMGISQEEIDKLLQNNLK